MSQGTGILTESIEADQDGAELADSESSDVEEEQIAPISARPIEAETEVGTIAQSLYIPLACEKTHTHTHTHTHTLFFQMGLRRVSSMPELWIDFLLCDFGLITRQRSKWTVYVFNLQCVWWL